VAFHPFRRASVRYGDTPQPVTPYQKAAQVWDERLGSARVQAMNWRIAALAMIGIALLLCVTLAITVGRSGITPYVVEVDRLGEVRAVGPAIEPSRASHTHDVEGPRPFDQRASSAIWSRKFELDLGHQIADL
jgi:type IV secretion system protein VirB5